MWGAIDATASGEGKTSWEMLRCVLHLVLACSQDSQMEREETHAAAKAASRLTSTTPLVCVNDQFNSSIITMCHVAFVRVAMGLSSGSPSISGSKAIKLALRASNLSKHSRPVIVVQPETS